MIPAFTIILPHKRNPGNDAALKICLDMLMANTANDFVLSMDAACDEPLYPRINRMVEDARTQYCVIISSDIFMAPRWDIPMMAAINCEQFITGVVVEPGAIGVHPQNLERNFGMTPSTFERTNFERWVDTIAPFPPGDGWVVPLMFPRDLWLSMGGLDLSELEFPHSLYAPDQKLLDGFKASGGTIKRVRSYAYHLQRWSDEGEQMHTKRSGQ